MNDSNGEREIESVPIIRDPAAAVAVAAAPLQRQIMSNGVVFRAYQPTFSVTSFDHVSVVIGYGRYFEERLVCPLSTAIEHIEKCDDRAQSWFTRAKRGRCLYLPFLAKCLNLVRHSRNFMMHEDGKDFNPNDLPNVSRYVLKIGRLFEDFLAGNFVVARGEARPNPPRLTYTTVDSVVHELRLDDFPKLENRDRYAVDSEEGRLIHLFLLTQRDLRSIVSITHTEAMMTSRRHMFSFIKCALIVRRKYGDSMTAGIYTQLCDLNRRRNKLMHGVSDMMRYMEGRTWMAQSDRVFPVNAMWVRDTRIKMQIYSEIVSEMAREILFESYERRLALMRLRDDDLERRREGRYTPHRWSYANWLYSDRMDVDE
jgi:hypothetical protein